MCAGAGGVRQLASGAAPGGLVRRQCRHDEDAPIDTGTECPNSNCAQVLAVYGSWHLGQLQVGLSGAVRLAQCRTLQLTARAPLPMQIDGEPWYQSPARVSVKLQGKVGLEGRCPQKAAPADRWGASFEVARLNGSCRRSASRFTLEPCEGSTCWAHVGALQPEQHAAAHRDQQLPSRSRDPASCA